MMAQTECRKAGLKMNKYAGSPSVSSAKPRRHGRNVLSVSLLWRVQPMPLHGLLRSALRVAGPAGAGACFVKVGGAGKRAEATARPERAVRSGAAYFAASTRVLCGKYSSILRSVRFGPAQALSRFPVRADEEKWMSAKSFSPRCSPFSAESINFAQHYPKRPCSSMDRTTVS